MKFMSPTAKRAAFPLATTVPIFTLPAQTGRTIALPAGALSTHPTAAQQPDHSSEDYADTDGEAREPGTIRGLLHGSRIGPA
jgi:hypothetical protein